MGFDRSLVLEKSTPLGLPLKWQARLRYYANTQGSFPKTSLPRTHTTGTTHRFEHWYRDNTVYFITARCRNKTNAFASEEAKQIFWDRADFYSEQYGFTPFVQSLLDNHYHRPGYLKIGANLGPMMRHIHGSVAKLVNDTLEFRLTPFWYDTGKQGYFDGCIRDENQCRKAYRYTLTQSMRHGICTDWRDYPHTRVNIEVDIAVKRAIEKDAFMTGVPYKRYLDARRLKYRTDSPPGLAT